MTDAPPDDAAPASSFSWIPDLKAFVILSWGWAAIAGIVAIVVLIAVPHLPDPVTLVFPGFRGAGAVSYQVAPVSAALVSAIVVVVFAVLIIVMRLLVAEGRVWIAIVLILVDAVVVVAAFATLTSVLFQWGHATAIGTGLNRLPIVSVLEPEGYVVLAVVLASGLFVTRRLTLGRWRARR